MVEIKQPDRIELKLEDIQKSYPWIQGKAYQYICEAVHTGKSVVAFPSEHVKDLVIKTEAPNTNSHIRYAIEDFKRLEQHFLNFHPMFKRYLSTVPQTEVARIGFKAAMAQVLQEIDLKEKGEVPIIGKVRNKRVTSRLLHPQTIIEICNARMGCLGINCNVAIFQFDQAGMIGNCSTSLWKTEMFAGGLYTASVFD